MKISTRVHFHPKITQKLLLSSLLLIFLPLVLFTAYFCIRSTNSSKAEIWASIQSTFEQSYISVSNKLKYIQSSSYYFMVNSKLEVLTRTTPQSLPVNEQLDVKNTLSLLFPNKNFGSDIADTYVFLETAFPLLEASDKIYSFEAVQGNLWLSYVLDQSSYSCFIPSYLYEKDSDKVPGSLAPSDRLSFVRKVASPENYQETAAIVRFDFSKSELDTITDHTNCTPQSRTFLSDSSGHVIAGTTSPDVNWEPDFSTIGPFETLWTQERFQEQNYRTARRQVANTDWYLVSIVPEADIMAHSTTMEQQFILLALILLICTLVYIYYISISITGRIKTLSRNMRCYDSSQLNLIPRSLSRDEIGMLIDEYNYLITHIQTLLVSQEQNQKELRTSEIRALRAQMNPHFLYNTLEMLRWYAHKGDKTMIDEIIQQLFTFYKLSLNRGQEYYHVSDEIRLLQTYFNIMNLRYQNIMCFEVTADEDVLCCKIPIILLQPILENAIQHGLLLKTDRSGTIRLTAFFKKPDLIFQIYDDGVGMDISIMHEINQGTFHCTDADTQHGNSIGIKNVANRIYLLYGKGYGVKYTLPDDGGTLAVITIPAQF